MSDESVINTAPQQPRQFRIWPRFSLTSLLLLLSTVACLAGWRDAARRGDLARSETRALRRAVEEYRAELGFLDVVDNTKVYAVGRPPRAIDGGSWRWQMYFPTGNYQVHAVSGAAPSGQLVGPLPDNPLGKPLPLSGMHELELELAFNEDQGNQIATVTFDGTPFAKHYTSIDSKMEAWRWQGVRWGERRAWEPGEPIGLLMGEEVTAGDMESAAFVFWIQPLPAASQP